MLTIAVADGGRHMATPDFTGCHLGHPVEAVRTMWRCPTADTGIAPGRGTPKWASARPAAGTSPRVSSTAGSTTTRRDTYAGLLVWGLTQSTAPVISTMGPWSPWPCPRQCGSSRPVIAPRGPLRCLTDDPAQASAVSGDLRGACPPRRISSFSQSAAQQPDEFGAGLAASRCIAPSGNPMILRESDTVSAEPVRAGRHRLRAADGAVQQSRNCILAHEESAITSKYPRHKLGHRQT